MAKEYKELSTNLQIILFERNMRSSDLAKELSIPATTIHRIVTGKSARPHESTLKAIADFFNLTIKQLIGEESIAFNKKTSLFNKIGNLSRTIPIMSWKKEDFENQISRYEPLTVNNSISNECFALIMQDDSMFPIFPKETILIFDPNKAPENRSYVLVKLKNGDDLVFRELLVDDNYSYLKPLSSDLDIYKMGMLEKHDCIIACLIESRINHNK